MKLPKIDVPIYETKLISNGKVVKYRPFLIKEQKLFLMAAQSEDPKEIANTIKQVLINCIISDDVDVNELASFDLEYLFMKLRAKSVGEVVKLRYSCNNTIKDENDNEKKCGGVVKFDVDINAIEPTIDKDHNQKIELTPNMGVMMRYPNFNILSKMENEKNVDVFGLIAECIDFVYDKDNIYYAKDTSKEEIVEFLENMQQQDFEKIENFFKTMPKIKKDLEFKCPKCGYKEEITVEGVQNFFE